MLETAHFKCTYKYFSLFSLVLYQLLNLNASTYIIMGDESNSVKWKRHTESDIKIFQYTKYGIYICFVSARYFSHFSSTIFLTHKFIIGRLFKEKRNETNEIQNYTEQLLGIQIYPYIGTSS